MNTRLKTSIISMIASISILGLIIPGAYANDVSNDSQTTGNTGMSNVISMSTNFNHDNKLTRTDVNQVIENNKKVVSNSVSNNTGTGLIKNNNGMVLLQNILLILMIE